MDIFQEHLRIDIEKKVGFKINTTTDVKALLAILQEHTSDPISLSTLRRFWNLLPMRKSNNSTLDVLAKFLEYASYQDYVKKKNEYEKWLLDAKVQKLKLKETLDKEDFEFLSAVIEKSESNTIFISLFEYAFYNEKLDYCTALFDENNISCFKNKLPINHFQTNIAYILFIFLYGISKESFVNNIGKLVANKNFRENVIYIYIDIMGLNKRYGIILEKIEQESLSYEEQLFLKLLSGLKQYLNKSKDLPVINNLTRNELQLLPEVLVGRFYGYQMLCAAQNQNKEKEEIVWNDFLFFIKKEMHIRQYFHEFVHALLLLKKIQKLNYLLENYFEEIIDKLHMHSYLDLFIYNLIDVMVSFKNKDLKRAHHIFKNLDTTISKYGAAYNDYYLIFYTITGYHLATNYKEKQLFKEEYQKHVGLAQFKVFDEVYLETYFG
ncbi:hypothetical protein [Flavobacterium aciduliphilum]|uniref:Uncharacterized protein n=1 Tax=Flavobacterium aciduliphilum TaxID=1101402 RepID=A0A328YIA2_9FLAO|nr:hypothetical protein [Flavobacterium aciduliphilum]RAR73771.1 hypothetical protein CLV55_10390 [Flavobacterium aciduliphilum]